MTSPSALVETVSINYVDFNDSFLTCSTCLSMYDGADHSPKLLPCSHTVCKVCLESISTNNRSGTEDPTIRCPICRESITVPQGGVSALPPSFLVNQLLDLMARQRREIVPKCATHMSQELLFCETCDVIFCIMCAGSAHGGNHTVIPFSIAIKRMSEILLYKAHLCVKNLNTAHENVNTELCRLESNSAEVMDSVNQSFDQLVSLINKRRQETLSHLERISIKKKKSFTDQLQLIEAEKCKVNNECEGMESEMEVRHITKKIADLNERLDATQVLAEPRENAFIQYLCKDQMDAMMSDIMSFGKVKISTTFPALCNVEYTPAITFLQSLIKVRTIDYNGRPRMTGGDPIKIIITDQLDHDCSYTLTDHEDGTYSVQFMPVVDGPHSVNITIFDRPLKGSPYTIQASPHIGPISKVGGKGQGLLDFSQPTSITRDTSGNLYVLDTGNNRIKVLASDGAFIGHITTDGLEKQGCTGITITSTGTLMAINWKTKLITEMNTEGHVVKQFTSPELQHPTCIAVNSKNDVIVADMSAECLFIFDNTGRLIKKLDGNDADIKFSYVMGIAVAPNDDIIIADDHITVFDKQGRLKQEINQPPVKGKTQFYHGVTVDKFGNILATKTERGKCCIEVHRFEDRMKFNIDSYSDKLKRPIGLVTTDSHTVYVCDLGTHLLKQYPYK